MHNLGVVFILLLLASIGLLVMLFFIAKTGYYCFLHMKDFVAKATNVARVESQLKIEQARCQLLKEENDKLKTLQFFSKNYQTNMSVN